MEYYERGGGAVARLSFKPLSSGGTGGSSVNNCNQAGDNSFVGCFYHDRNFSDLVLTQNTGSIDFDWGGGSPDSRVRSDDFTARWRGNFDFQSGQHDFVVTADDGVRLYIDGQLVLDRWFDQSPTTYTVTRSLSAGKHEIVMEYYERGGGAVARLSFGRVSSGGTGGSSSNCDQVGNNFFVGCYYHDKNFTNLVMTQNTGSIDFDWGGGSPDSRVRSDDFAVRWRGDFDFASGQHEFVVTADDGVRLYIDGQLVLDRWFDQAATTYTVTRSLSAGRHEIRLEYYERGEEAVARLSW
jgi:hypothetical protein